MEKQYQKWVNLSYVAAAILVGYIVYVATQKVTALYDVEVRIRNIDLFIRLLSLVAGGIVFFVLSRHKEVNKFMNEVVVELSRVTWPTQKETSSATFIVIIMVLISGVVLGFLDYVWTKVLQLVV
jgi:preprotein translocase subunit SecE